MTANSSYTPRQLELTHIFSIRSRRSGTTYQYNMFMSGETWVLLEQNWNHILPLHSVKYIAALFCSVRSFICEIRLLLSI